MLVSSKIPWWVQHENVTKTRVSSCCRLGSTLIYTNMKTVRFHIKTTMNLEIIYLGTPDCNYMENIFVDLIHTYPYRPFEINLIEIWLYGRDPNAPSTCSEPGGKQWQPSIRGESIKKITSCRMTGPIVLCHLLSLQKWKWCYPMVCILQVIVPRTAVVCISIHRGQTKWPHFSNASSLMKSIVSLCRFL